MTATNYIWDFENDSYLMEKADSGATTAVYANEPVQYGELVSQRRGSQTSYYHFDGQGSTRHLTDAGGNVTDSYMYSAFGEMVALSGMTTNPLRFVGVKGYYLDTETTTYYIRARIYAPPVARWFSVDPTGFTSAITNAYDYVANQPMLTDPSGHAIFGPALCTPPGAAVGAGTVVIVGGYYVGQNVTRPALDRVARYITRPYTQTKPAPKPGKRPRKPPNGGANCSETGFPLCDPDDYANAEHACLGPAQELVSEVLKKSSRVWRSGKEEWSFVLKGSQDGICIFREVCGGC